MTDAVYKEAHEAVAVAAAKCAALDATGRYDGASLVSEIADALLDLFEDVVDEYGSDAPVRINSCNRASIHEHVNALTRAICRSQKS